MFSLQIMFLRLYVKSFTDANCLAALIAHYYHDIASKNCAPKAAQIVFYALRTR